MVEAEVGKKQEESKVISELISSDVAEELLERKRAKRELKNPSLILVLDAMQEIKNGRPLLLTYTDKNEQKRGKEAIKYAIARGDMPENIRIRCSTVKKLCVVDIAPTIINKEQLKKEVIANKKLKDVVNKIDTK